MKLLTNNFRTWLARQFVSGFSTPASYSALINSVSRYVNYGYVETDYVAEVLTGAATLSDIVLPDISYYYYVFAGTSTIQLPNTTSICPDTSIYGSQYNVFDGMKFGKRALAEDVSLMIARNEWTSKVYDEYDDKDILLHEKEFFVSVEEAGDYHVFECISNNNRAISTVKPSPAINSTANVFYQTVDGYIWMYLYSIPNAIYKKFATKNFIPLTSRTTENPTSIGSIETMDIQNQGAYYHSTVGSFKSTNVDGLTNKFYLSVTADDMFTITNFYQDYAIYLSSGKGSGQLQKITASGIVGNNLFIEIETAFAEMPDTTTTYEIVPYISIVDSIGTGAIAKAVVVAGKLTDILMIGTGAGYTSSTVNVLGQTGYYDLAGVFIKTTTTALVRAIVSPPKGHGRDLVNELYADKVCVSVDFIEDQHPLVSYSQYGLMANPAFKTVSLELNEDPVLLSVGEMLIQSPTASYGIIKSIVGKTIILSNVFGSFEKNINAVGVSSKEQVVVNTINTLLEVNEDPVLLSIGEILSQSPTIYGTIKAIVGKTIVLGNVFGIFDKNINAVGSSSKEEVVINTINTSTDKFTISEIVDNSAEILLIRDDALTARSATQTERIKLLIDF